MASAGAIVQLRVAPSSMVTSPTAPGRFRDSVLVDRYSGLLPLAASCEAETVTVPAAGVAPGPFGLSMVA